MNKVLAFDVIFSKPMFDNFTPPCPVSNCKVKHSRIKACSQYDVEFGFILSDHSSSYHQLRTSIVSQNVMNWEWMLQYTWVLIQHLTVCVWPFNCFRIAHDKCGNLQNQHSPLHSQPLACFPHFTPAKKLNGCRAVSGGCVLFDLPFMLYSLIRTCGCSV